MPKSAKKRKEKAADFSKAKLKLGKGKQLASNAIDTSFKARSIALPTQSIAHIKYANAPTTKRKLTFDDLITHTKHYSPATRKDAILGLRELLEAHWEILQSSLTALINACARIIGDEDASVRGALLAFFAWLLPRISHEDILPHSQLLILFTTSAQTHIFPEIRIDAIRLLNIFLQYIPKCVIAGWNTDKRSHGARVLEGYLGLLNAGIKFGEADGPLQATSTASVVISPASRAVVLQSLSTFLRVALSSLTVTLSESSHELSTYGHNWYMVSCFSTALAYHSFEDLLRSSDSLTTLHRTWKEEFDPNDLDDIAPSTPSSLGLSIHPQWSLQDLVQGNVAWLDPDIHENVDIGLLLRLARSLHPVLVATFLDCAPLVFSPFVNPSETEVQSISTVGQILRSLYCFILQSSAKGSHDSSMEDLAEILSHMAPYFPFSSSESRNIKLEQALQDLNLIFCELVSLQIHTETHHRNKSRQTARCRLSTKDAWSTQILRVGEYILQILRGEAATSSQLGKPLTRDAYIALLPSVWALLNSTRADLHEISVAVLHAAISHSIRTSCKSTVKISTIEFIAQLVLVGSDPLYQGHFQFSRDDEKLGEWIEHLPQALWELGANSLPASELILRFLLRILQRRARLTLGFKIITALRSKLAPYFSVCHAVRGQLLGPFTKLPVSCMVRKLALNVVMNLLSVEGGDKERLCAAVDLAVVETEEQRYWVYLRKRCISTLEKDSR